jgi:aspartyl/asparaginyl beta-hydroxylase (cupin superfamily)
MKLNMAAVEERASEEERGRIARFRSNVLRRTRPFHSDPTHFHYPGLVEREFHPRRLFPWIEHLEAMTEGVAAELKSVMAAERAELVPYIQYAEHQPLAQWRPLNRNPDWTAIHLWQNGRRIDANADQCPNTMSFLEGVGQPSIRGACPNAMFSLLAPHTAIPPHVGVNNARLVCHLPLIVPEGCWFRVGAETREWRPGEAFVFDDTIEHEALNPTDQLRVVFIFDVWHPDLGDVEREAVTALIEADEGSGAPL